MTHHLMAGLTWANTGRDPEALVALQVLEAMRSLPHFDRRVDPADLATVEGHVAGGSRGGAAVNLPAP